MKEKNNLNSIEGFKFYTQLEHFDPQNSKFTLLLNDLKGSYESIISTWALKMRSNQCDQIIAYDKSTDFFAQYSNDLIKQAFTKDDKIVNNIILCVSQLQSKNSLISAYESLYNEMNLNNYLDSSQLLVLVYNVNLLFIKYPEDLKIQLFKGKLPTTIGGLVQNDVGCTIKSHLYNEYFYASVYFYKSDGKRRYVYTYRRP